MSDAIKLSELALNQRTISDPKYGEFIVRRPTHRIEADIDSARTRQLNRDLQTREMIPDPETGGQKQVPAYLSRAAKREQLIFHGIWSDNHDFEIQEASEKYQEACYALEMEGFEGAPAMLEELAELRTRLESLVDDPAPVREAIALLTPEPDLEVSLEDFAVARATLQEAGKSRAMDEALGRADRLHKLAGLYRAGVDAQMELFALRITEFSLFADTLEARADKAAQVAKVFYCALDPSTSKPYFKSLADVEDGDLEMVMWLVGQIERFQRLEPGQTEADLERRERYNFLAPSQQVRLVSDVLRAVETSSSDGDSQDTLPSPSTKD